MNLKEKILSLLQINCGEPFMLYTTNSYSLLQERYYISNVDLKIYSYEDKTYSNIPLSDILIGKYTIVKLKTQEDIVEEESIAIKYAQVLGCKWIAKDYNGSVYAYEKKPYKDDEGLCWITEEGKTVLIGIPISFLKWEDAEPYFLMQ